MVGLFAMRAEVEATAFVVTFDTQAGDGLGDVEKDGRSHTTPDDYPIAEKFMKNFAAAFSPM